MLALVLSAELQGIVNLAPVDTKENPFYYMFKVECTSCRYQHDTWVGISRFDQLEMQKSRGVTNFIWKCKECKRESTATVTAGPTPYGTQNGLNKAAQILQLDCRGLELLAFKPEGQWTAKGTDSGKIFDEVELDEGEWYDYDDKAGQEVYVKEMKWEINRAGSQ